MQVRTNPVTHRIEKTPFWWEAAKPQGKKGELPFGPIDVLVIGAGYTGLSAARTLAGRGLDVLIIDREVPGYGASSRNGGMVGNLLKPGLSGLISAYGEEKGIAIAKEAVHSVAFLKKLIETEDIDCDFALNGRLYPAVLKKHFVSMAAESEKRSRYLGADEEILEGKAYQEDLGSELYVGGIRQYETGGLHPAKYLQGLVGAVEKAGAHLIAPCEAKAFQKVKDGFDIQTTDGSVRARHVLFATNGYGGTANTFLQRRIMPIGSTMIATEPLGENRIKALFPSGRMIADSRKMLSYYRPSPDGQRVLLGGRPTILPASPEEQARSLQKRLCEIFPELRQTAVSHVWSGNVAYGFDALPTIGRHEGVYYALGYCGSGVAMSGYLGHKAALQILAEPEGVTAFDDLPFPDRPYYHGRPWFVPLAMIGYAIRDRFGF